MKIIKDCLLFEMAILHIVRRHLEGTLPAELEAMALRWLEEADSLRAKQEAAK